MSFLLSPPRYRTWLVFAALILNLAFIGALGFPPRTLISIPEAALLAHLTRRFCPTSLNFADPRTLVTYVACAVVPASLASALAVYLLPNDGPSLTTALKWFEGHLLGSAFALPTTVTTLRRRRFSVFRRPAWEFILACTAMTAMMFTVFSLRQPMLSVTVLPVAMFLSFRFGPVGASIVSMLVIGIANVHIFVGIPGQRPLSHEDIERVQTPAEVMFLTCLPAAGALASLRRMRRLLARRTEIARLARRLADAAALAKSQFLATMSHEIRTPLNGVIGLADALSRTPLRADQQEMLGMIRNSGQALNGILSDVLDLARADAGALKLAAEPFDPAEAIGAASYLFANVAKDKGIGFHVSLDIPAGYSAEGDALRIRQVVSNLISNAVKFTHSGHVAIRAVFEPLAETGVGRLIVTVTDTGVGFDGEIKARLFRRFEQADASISRRFGGTGLGLAISRELAERMGGRIDCRSEPGQGSEFIFSVSLPLRQGAPPADAGPACNSAAPIMPVRLKVLLAEDHPVNQRVIQIILGDAADLTVVADGQRALEACDHQSFDLILMDTQMPVMDGLTAIRAIRRKEADEGRAATPIISLTADAMPHQVQASIAAGADRHLAKPITADALLSAMSAALEQKAA